MMVKLKIKPVEYKERNLQELGERVATVFYPLIDDFEILDEIDLKALLENKTLYDATVLMCCPVRFEAPFNIYINGDAVSHFLALYGVPILGITQLPLIPSGKRGHLLNSFYKGPHNQLFGGYSNRRSQAAIASTYLEHVDSENGLERLITTSIHEAGHILGLKHHWRVRKNSRGMLCAMTLEINNRPFTIPKSNGPIDYLPCQYCYQKLGIETQRVLT